MESHFTLALPLAGTFEVDVEGVVTAATPAKAVLFSVGQVRQVHHPYGGHDESAYISMSSGFAEPFLDTRGRFRALAHSTSPDLDYRLRHLVAAARSGHVGPLEVEEFTVDVMNRLMGGHRVGAVGTRRDVVVAAEEYLSVHFREPCSLATIAQQVGYSSHHLSRSFKQITGESLSRRRMRIRLAHAVSEILSGAEDLAMVAVETGFYDHSHMTNSFRSHLGMSPTEIRTTRGSASARGVGRGPRVF